MIFTDIRIVSDEGDRCWIVEDVIKCLPGWFLEGEAEYYSAAAQNAVVFAAYFENRPVGFLLIELKAGRGVAEILAMGVKPSYQHLGIGRTLMVHAIEYAVSERVNLLEVKTADYSDPDQNYIATRTFYEKNGFVALDTINNYWQDGTPVLIMVKHLVFEHQVYDADLNALA